MKESIEKNIRIRIKDSKMIYSYDPLNTTNIHRYIDLKEHIVLVIKLINNYCIAGYYQGAFRPKVHADRQGLIMSLENRKVYLPVERNRRSIVYDDYFVIWGNSEIRVKTQEKKVFSNFGLNNSYYKNNGEKVDMFLGGSPGQREMDFQYCEFYSLVLQ